MKSMHRALIGAANRPNDVISRLNRLICIAFTAVLGLVISSPIYGGEVTIPNTFQSGTPAVAADVNENFTAVKEAVDGNASDITNLATSASWHQLLTTDRFQLVMYNQTALDYQAVLDKETGLVWDRYPDTSSYSWANAIERCYKRIKENRRGWRLPTVEELSTLVYSGISNPSLPAGHPFVDVQNARYWTSTTATLVGDRTYAWYVGFGNGEPHYELKSTSYNYWCVRGGHGYDTY